VLESPGQNVGDDLHIAMGVRWKPATSRDHIFIDHAQGAEAHIGRIEIVSERECVSAVEPVDAGVAAIFGFAQGQHDVT